MSGQVFTSSAQLVVVHDGRRGAPGLKGDKGDAGDQGGSINILGAWSPGTTYSPLDAVSWRSSLTAGVNSLYVQRSTVAAAPSSTPPNEDLSRWTEIGAVDWDNAFGGIWEVLQLDHGFTAVGQPVGYSYQSESYVLADSRNLDELGVAIVREIVSPDRVVLQSSGEIPGLNPDVIWPSGSSWEPGRVYYVSPQRGYVQITKPTDSSHFVNPIVIPTRDAGGGKRDGVALPWTPTGGPSAGAEIPVGRKKFFYTATSAQTVFTGPDSEGNTMSYTPGTNTDVFYNGALLNPAQYEATDGATVTLLGGLVGAIGQVLQVWTPDRPLSIPVPSTVVKIDNIESGFNGTLTVFKLRVATVALDLTTSLNTMIWLDGNPQEADVDYVVSDDPGEAGTSIVTFAFAPPAGTRFWGIVFAPEAP